MGLNKGCSTETIITGIEEVTHPSTSATPSEASTLVPT